MLQRFIRSYADGLLRQVEAAEIDSENGVLTLTLTAAVDALNNFEANTEWVTTVRGLLVKREDELNVNDYQNIGNDLMQKIEVESKLNKLRLFFQI